MVGTEKKRQRGASFDLPYGVLFLAAAVALILLLTLQGTGAVSFLLLPAALVLFALPGAVLTGLLMKESYDPLAKAPLVFVLSTGTFGLLALPPLVLKWSLDTYLLICGGIVTLSLIGAILLAVRPSRGTESEVRARGERWLWVPLGAMTAVLAALSLRLFYAPNSDTWAYLMYVQKFLELGKINSFIPGFGRSSLSGWLLEQAAISRLSGVEPVDLALNYLTPLLVVMGVLAFYNLASTLFEKPAALLSSSLATLFFLIYLDSSYRSAGYEFIGRILEDKFFVRFIFLPVALGLAILFLRKRRLLYLGLFALVSLSAVSVHPLGLVLIGMSVAGFGLVYLAVNRRNPESWKPFGALAGVLIGIVLPPLAYLVATENPFLSRSTSANPDAAAYLISSWQEQELLLALGENSYIMHPSLLLNPVILVAYVVGVPFLIWRVERDLAAQLLLGMLMLTAALIYFPPVATFIGQIIGPWSLWRLAWPIPLAALLTTGWMAWEGLKYLGTYLGRMRVGPRVSSLLPLFLVCILIVAFAPRIAEGARSAAEQGETPQDATVCTDPTFPWMKGELEIPAKMLAQDPENSCFPAYVPANFVAYRSQLLIGDDTASSQAADAPQNVADVEQFFDAAAVDEDMVATLRRYQVDYVLVPIGSPLNVQLQQLPGFEAMDNPGYRYQIYEVDRTAIEVTQLSDANGFLNRGEWESALAAYKLLLEGDADQQFLALLGMGQAYMQLELPAEAVASYEQAIQLSDEDPLLYSLLAEAYAAMGDQPSARTALEKAVSIAPRQVGLRLELGDLLLKMGNEQEALDQYRAVVEMYPQVPEYHIRLGEALNRTEDFEAADEEFSRAVGFDPRSASLYEEVGLANRATRRFEQAAAYYEEALAMEPSDRLAYRLGVTYFQLSVQNREDEEYFLLAERSLRKVGELGPGTQEDALRRMAQFTLGKLYEVRDRKQKAIAAYERALDIEPGFGPARERLEELRE